MAKIVWVLGAGFSRSLGGPLMADLFTEEADNVTRIFYPKDKFPLLGEEVTTRATKLFRYGARPGGVEKLWGDPEEYLARLDTAVRRGADSSTWEHLTHVLARSYATTRTYTLDEVSNAARRVLAAQCSAFLQEIDTTEEKWTPYHHWSNQLGRHDTVMTFNYDQVLENLADAGASFSFRLPGQKIYTVGSSWVLKLHGSIDWRMTSSEGNTSCVRAGRCFALTGPADELVIAGPGPQKRDTINDQLSDLWNDAEERLQQCDGIVFLGYRFPDADASAVDRFIRAIIQNNNPKLKIYVVLGNSSPDAAGVVEMLQRIVRTPKPEMSVFHSSLRAERFIACYDKDRFAAELEM
jgi:hypothetical protein